jgi:hypothetical protein
LSGVGQGVASVTSDGVGGGLCSESAPATAPLRRAHAMNAFDIFTLPLPHWDRLSPIAQRLLHTTAQAWGHAGARGLATPAEGLPPSTPR